jgi:hypothetical protein
LAYPGETPTFNGAQAVSGSWTTDGSYKYIAYTPQAVVDGGGITFSTGQNLNGDGVGKYPDQAWIGSTQLRQVTDQSSLNDGEFWVDRTNNRLYLTPTDAAKSAIEVSSLVTFMTIQGSNSSVEGLRLTRFSTNGSNAGAISISGGATHITLRNIEISQSAFVALNISGSTNSTFADGTLFENLTLTTSNWMGIGVNYTNNLTMDGVKIIDMNQFDEFAKSPASGAVKTSRTWYTTIKNSYIANNNSKGLWFDQSNYKTTVANSMLIDNADSQVFFEISDNLLLINNYIHSVGTGVGLKSAGSSGLRLVNNTFVGGSAPWGVNVDNRSIAGCSDPAEPLCANSYSSDRDTLRPHLDTIDWIPRIDMSLNNIFAYPTGNGGCGSTNAPLCMTLVRSAATVPIESIIHKADASRGIPQTVMNGDVFVNSANTLIGIGTSPLYTSLSAFSTAMASSPVSISGLEAIGAKSGTSWVNPDGSPTAALTAANNEAFPIPTDTAINAYIPSGTKHYGRLP